MAIKLGLRNFSRSGNTVTFTVVALNANGTVDTNFTGQVTFGTSNFTGGLTPYTFTAGDQGARVFTTTIGDPAFRATFGVSSPATSAGASLIVGGPTGETIETGNNGDNLFVGGTGNDNYIGRAGDDLFRMERGGNDTATGRAGNDGFYFGGAYTSADTVNGGDGVYDSIGLQGDYSGGVTLGSMLETELVVLLPGNDTRFGDLAGNLYDYNIVANASTIVTNNRLTIQANTLRVGEDVTFNGSASAIDVLIYGGFGTENLTGGSGNDGFFFGQGRFGASDVVNGGAGTMDQLGLQGDFSGANAITFGAAQISGIEFIVLLSASDNRFGSSGGTVGYVLATNNANVAAGQTLIVSANTLKVGENVEFDGSAELDGRFEIYSGDGNDVLRGGAGNDVIFGGGSGDTMTGGGGNDVFAYRAVTDSDQNERDGIGDFNLGDRIDVSRIDANVNLAGVQGFTFVGMTAFSGQAGELRYQNVGGNLFQILGDTNGDSVGDLDLFVVITDGHTLTANDFIGATASQASLLKPQVAIELDAPVVNNTGAPESENFAGSAGGYNDAASVRDLKWADAVSLDVASLDLVSLDLHGLGGAYDLVL